MPVKDDMKINCTPGELRELYIGKQMTMQQIAVYLHVEKRSIRRAMRKWGIPVRDRSTRARLTAQNFDFVYHLQGHYRAYQRGAYERGYIFELSIEQFEKLVVQNCYYCGSYPSHRRGSNYFNGIDRVDSKQGYIEGNVRPCCWKCNLAKTTMPQEEFITWILRAADHIRANGIDLLSSPQETESQVAS